MQPAGPEPGQDPHLTLRSCHTGSGMSRGAVRWGLSAPEDIVEARTRILDAAKRSFEARGVLKATVEDIARAAQVSRATVYRYFADRDAILLGVLLRDTDQYLCRARARIERQPTLGAAILEFVDLTARAATRDVSLGMLFAGEEARATGGIVAGASAALFERVGEFFRPMFLRWSSQVRPGVDAGEASEWILRVLLSQLTVEGPRRRSAAAQRAYVERFLLPAVVCSDGDADR